MGRVRRWGGYGGGEGKEAKRVRWRGGYGGGGRVHYLQAFTGPLERTL